MGGRRGVAVDRGPGRSGRPAGGAAGAPLQDPAVLAARKAALAEEFWPCELAPALHTSVDQARARIARARLLAG